MTVCNMSIEAGGRAGLIAFDEVTRDYVKGRPYAPAGELWDRALAHWSNLHSDADAVFDSEVVIDAAEIAPQVSWGTSPEMVVAVDAAVPDPEAHDDEMKRIGMRNALKYMDLKPGTAITDIAVDKVFIGSCTNSRIEDLQIGRASCRERG